MTFRDGVAGLCLLALLVWCAPAEISASPLPPDQQVTAKLRELTDQAKAAYTEGRTSDAVKYLQQAIQVLQEEGVKGLASFTPKVPKGWKAEEAKTTSGTWGAGGESFQWNNVTRRYTRESDNARMDVTITNWPQVVMAQSAAIKMFKSNPMMAKMMNQDPNKKVELIEQDGWFGMRQVQKGRQGSVMVMGKNIMVMLEMRKDDEAALDTFWKGVDLKGLGSLDKSGQ